MMQGSSLKKKVKDFLRYSLQGKYNGPSIQEIYDDVKKMKEDTTFLDNYFAVVNDRCVKNYKPHPKNYYSVVVAMLDNKGRIIQRSVYREVKKAITVKKKRGVHSERTLV